MELDQVAKLKRYFFLGKLKPVFTLRKLDSLIDDIDAVKYLLSGVGGDSFITLVKTLTQREEVQLPRRNEVWFVYAVYLSTIESVEDRKKVYQSFPEVARTAEDLFMTVHYASLIQKKKGSKGHSRTMRKAIGLWYEAKSEENVIQMFEQNRGMYGLTHKDLIVFSHIKMENTGFASLQHALFKPAGKAFESAEALEITKRKTPENYEKLKSILELKSCKEPSRAVELIEKHKFPVGAVPNFLLHKAEVWEALLPQIKYLELLTSMYTLIDSKLIGHQSLSAQFIKAVGNTTSLAAAAVSPISMLIHAKKLQTKKRYSERKKAMYYAEKVKRHNIKENPLLVVKVMNMFKKSFDHVKPKTGLKFCIVMNLQTTYATKPVFRHSQITCTDAAITLALMYFRSESNVDVFTYTPMQTNIEKLNWVQGLSFDDAQTICKSKQSPKNAQRLVTPLAEACKKGSEYDVFLIIVSSGARCNPSNKPDLLIQSLNTYRAKKNEKARVIVVNMRRYTPSMIHDESKPLDNGILEICGFGENIISVINAYASHSFS